MNEEFENMNEEEEEISSEGYDTIMDALGELYPNQDGFCYAPQLPYVLGGNDPLDGIHIFKSENGVPHWHYITCGFTELYEKESDNMEESGFGFELTFRLQCEKEDEEPPVWPVNLLNNISRYVFSSGNTFAPGHHMNCNGPVMLGADTKLTALGFCMDSELGEMDTPNGHMTFVQAVAITADEMEGMMCWDGKKFLGEMAKRIPLCAAKLSRDSLMEDVGFHAIWQAGVEKDGASTGFFYVDMLGIELVENGVLLQFGAGNTSVLRTMLQARLSKGKDFYLQGEEFAIQFSLAQTQGAGGKDDFYVVNLTKESLDELCEVLQPKAGIYYLKTMNMAVAIEVTEIRDNNGNIIETIG